MKFNQKNRMAHWLWLISVTLAMGLVACSGGNGSSSGGGKPATGPTTGKLTNAAVSGVAYSTSSKMAGITDDRGIYNYNHGDTVEFKLGSLILGKVKAAAIVTPIDLAGDSNTRLQNLLVLLQSLDSDNDPGNGISIPTNAAAAVSASINLDSDPTAFASSSALQGVRKAGGVAGEVKTAAEAKAHFLSQAMSLFSTDVWVKYDDTTATVIRTSVANAGEYLFGEATPDDACDIDRVCGSKLISKAGVEYGAVSVPEFDTRGFKFAGAPTIDTNLQAGLSHLRPNWRIYTDGFELITTDIVVAPREREQSSIFGELFHIAKPLKLSSSKEPIKTIIHEVRFSKMENIEQCCWLFYEYTRMIVEFKKVCPNKQFLEIKYSDLIDKDNPNYLKSVFKWCGINDFNEFKVLSCQSKIYGTTTEDTPKFKDWAKSWKKIYKAYKTSFEDLTNG
ncbi:MAG: adhesin [Proteobacteria bacterium]|nr:adhesin [Pseudomonadota bacterium]